MSAPLVTVDSASTSPHPAGGVVLFVNTPAGPGRLHFPESIAAQLFVVTNAPSERSRENKTGRRSHTVAAPELVALYEQVAARVRDGATWRAAGKTVGVDPWKAYKYFATLRARAKQELRAAVSTPASTSP